MTEQNAHPMDQTADGDPSDFLQPPEPGSIMRDPGDAERVPRDADTVGHATDVDPRRPMSLEELGAIRDQAEVEAEIDATVGPTRAEERPIAVLYLPMNAVAVGGILQEVDEHFPGCVLNMAGDRMVVLPKPQP